MEGIQPIQTQTSPRSLKKKIGLVFLGLFAVLVIVYLATLGRTIITYPIALLRCTGQPVLGSDIALFGTGKQYYMPGTADYTINHHPWYPSIFSRDRYFCTEEEAQAAGYRKETGFEDTINFTNAEKTNDPAQCKTLDKADDRSGCIYGIAEKTRNPAICSTIEDARSGSRDICYERLAMIVKDATVCASISDLNSRNYCVIFLDQSPSNISLCDAMVADYSRKKEGCYSKLAEANNDLNLCNNAVSLTSCLTGVLYHYVDTVVSEQGPSACLFQKMPFLFRSKCVQTYVKKTRDASQCSVLPEVASMYQHDNVYRDREPLLTDRPRYECYRFSATSGGDVATCDKLTDEKNRTLCKTYFEEVR